MAHGLPSAPVAAAADATSSKLALLTAAERRLVEHHVAQLRAFDVAFIAGHSQHGFDRCTMERRLRMLDVGTTWARCRDEETKAYATVDVCAGFLHLDDGQWTDALMAIYRSPPAPAELSVATTKHIEGVRRCSWYVRKAALLDKVYRVHRRRLPCGVPVCSSLAPAVSQLLAEDCSHAERAELIEGAGSVPLEEAIEDCVVQDTIELHARTLRERLDFASAVTLGRDFWSASDFVDRAIAMVRLQQWAREVEQPGFPPDLNAFAFVRSMAAAALNPEASVADAR